MRFFKDKAGKYKLWQRPNVPLSAWFFFMLISRFVPMAHIQSLSQFLSTAFLFTWAYLEITSGASYFRRLLGLVIIAGIIASHAG